MCIICISERGQKQPSETTIREMFRNNPHGAGFMWVEDGAVSISKGYMDVDDLLRTLRGMNFTNDDVVVYHFRISTQAGVQPPMTQPFPWTKDITETKALDIDGCPCGIAHNGIIRMTSDYTDKEYSDTAHFVAEYLPYIVRSSADLRNPAILEVLEELTGSKLAILDKSGHVAKVGKFTEDDGILYSNDSYKPRKFTYDDVDSYFSRKKDLRITM